jgi:hypothetical protein
LIEGSGWCVEDVEGGEVAPETTYVRKGVAEEKLKTFQTTVFVRKLLAGCGFCGQERAGGLTRE